MGLLLGYNGKSPHAPLNSEIGRFAKRIAKHYDIQFTERSSRKYKYLDRSEEHTSELQSRSNLVCRLLLEKKKC